MKVLKKAVFVAAMLLACTFGFAQEAESGKSSSGVKGMYAGMQTGGGVVPGWSSIMAGGSVGCFEMTPYFGMYLFDALPDLALEFDLQMDFTNQSYSGYAMKYHMVSPQVLAAYTFDIGKVNPFLKAGVSVNFSGGSYAGEEIDAATTLSIVLNPGVSCNINDNIVLVFFSRFNFNDFQTYNRPVISEGLSIATRTLGVGFDYHF